MAKRPNVLIVMTDEERYPPPYEDDTVRAFRRAHLPARERIRGAGLEFHRHYAGSTACLPSRTTLFTGQYPSLHGAISTDGLAKPATDPDMQWLDPDTVPTIGDWFRAIGYRTHYRGKWHISHADLVTPGTHESLRGSDRDGNVIPEGVEAYRRADRLDGFGFSGWLGREPHGADPSDMGFVRDGIYAAQVSELFDSLATESAADPDAAPWLAVASFVNPHDIAFSGAAWQLLGLPPIDDHVPSIPAAPSQSDAVTDRPRAQQQWLTLWPEMLYEQPADDDYRRFYYWLHAVVDVAIGRILDALEESGLAGNTIVVFTSDHGDLLGAHGGLQQKWYNAYDEAVRVPLIVAGPGIACREGGVEIPTSHVDLLPTLLGLVGADVSAAAQRVAAHHVETHPLPGRDLSALFTGEADPETVDTPIYFMTEDQISQGSREQNLFSGTAFAPVTAPAKVEAVITRLPSGPDGAPELWKLNHYYDRLRDWETANGLTPFGDPAPAPDQWELHNLTIDPEERDNRVDDPTLAVTLATLRVILDDQRSTKRLVPSHRNPPVARPAP